MDGVRPVCVSYGMAVVCATAGLHCPVRTACPASHLLGVWVSSAVMSHSLPRQVLWCVVACVCLWCSCGGVSCVCSPLVVVVGGAVVDGGVA